VQENEAPAFTHGRLRTFSDSKPTGMNGLVDGTPIGFDTGGLWQHLRQHPSFGQASAFAALTSNGNVNIRNTDPCQPHCLGPFRLPSLAFAVLTVGRPGSSGSGRSDHCQYRRLGAARIDERQATCVFPAWARATSCDEKPRGDGDAAAMETVMSTS